MAPPTHGFAFMRQPSALAAAYDASPVALARVGDLSHLRATLANCKPQNYRGIGRYPLNADYDYKDPGWQWERRPSGVDEQLGTLAVEEALGLKTGAWRGEDWLIDGPWLLPDLARAQAVRAFLKNPAAFELVEVARYPARTTRPPLGFDVGWWASGNFSIICDAAVWPLWHPPPIEALSTLAEALSGLNNVVLFTDVSSAERYRTVYREQDWAEHEDKRFDIIEVAVVESAAA